MSHKHVNNELQHTANHLLLDTLFQFACLFSDKVLSFDAFNGHVTHVHCHSGAVNDLRIHAARTYTRMKYGPVFILGAVGSNTSDNTTWDHFRVYGLLDKTVYEEEKIQCCLMYKDKDDIITLQTEAISENRFSVPADLWRYHVGCPNVKHTEGKSGLLRVDFNCFNSGFLISLKDLRFIYLLDTRIQTL